MRQVQAIVGLPRVATETRMTIRGEVIRGDQRGRTIGFATANLALPADGIRPHDGVFAGYIHLPNGSVYPGAVSIGRRTTFYGDDGVLLAEAHLLGFEDDLYGAIITVELVGWLRGQVRFESIEELCSQLERDVLRCEDVLSTFPPSAIPPSAIPARERAR